MFKIGPWLIDKPTVLAPMAGVTDLPFRQLCRKLGAGLTVSEMVTSDSKLWGSRKSHYRLARAEDLAQKVDLANKEDWLDTEKNEPRSVQLAGNDPKMMAAAARANVKMGAQIIDINMGCPAKKVCKKAAGSALLKDEALVADILAAVVSAVEVPVTLKIRTGWDPDNRNGVAIARIAEDSGIQALAVHGRTRACAFKGEVEYDTIAKIVRAVDIPVLANGDIDSPEKAKAVLASTGAKAVMIGRGAQGNPWLFNEINDFLVTGNKTQAPKIEEIKQVVLSHIRSLHLFYGETMGAKIARKHVAWYLQYHVKNLLSAKNLSALENDGAVANNLNCPIKTFRQAFNRIESAQQQCDMMTLYFEKLATTEERAA